MSIFLLINKPWNAIQGVLIFNMFVFTCENRLEVLTRSLSNIVLTLYPIPILSDSFVNK